MVEKQSKVKSVGIPRKWDSKYGPMYDYPIEMENGDKGIYSAKSSDQKKFVAGQNASYEYDDTNTPQGWSEPKVTIKPLTAKKSSGGGYQQDDPFIRASYTNMTALESTMRVVHFFELNRAVDWPQRNEVVILNFVKGFNNWIMEKGGEDKQRNINARMAIRYAVDSVCDYGLIDTIKLTNPIKENIAIILEKANLYYQIINDEKKFPDNK